jgi:thioester reductase-like protein
VPGDLERPALGLSPAGFARLAEKIDVVLHNGARVNHLDPYAKLRAANVNGTAEILRLATTRRLKPVHFVSTCDTAVATDGNPAVVRETRRVTPDSLLPNGYVASKWVAEGLVLRAGERGVPVAVHRPSRIGGHSATGAAGTDDALWNLVRGMVVINAAPATAGHSDIVPADRVASTVVRLLAAGKTGATYHLTSSRPLELAEVIGRLRERGHRLEPLSRAEWITRLTEAADRAADEGDYRLSIAAVHAPALGAPGGPVVFGRENTLACLTDRPDDHLSVPSAVLDTYLDHFIDTGFFPSDSGTTR